MRSQIFEKLHVAVCDLVSPVSQAPRSMSRQTLVRSRMTSSNQLLLRWSDVQPTTLVMQIDVGYILEVEQLALPDFHGDWILIESPPLARLLASLLMSSFIQR